MAGLNEQAQWENEIYQIETTDPVVGGPPDLAQGQGITNVPAQQLANRTSWLKTQVEGLASTGFVTQAEIDAAIAALVAGAPGALDTLNEIATALTDNDDSIAAILTALAAKLDASEYTAADILAKIEPADVRAKSVILKNQEAADFTTDGQLGFDGSQGLKVYRGQQHGDAAGAGAYTVLDTANIGAGTGITITNLVADVQGNEAVTFSVTRATQAEAQNGTNNAAVMTPFLTKKAMAAHLAAQGYGAVGSYVFAYKSTVGPAVPGEIYAGADLYPAANYQSSVLGPNTFTSANHDYNMRGSNSLSGSWRAMGGNNYSTGRFLTLFMRIA